jgi:hypothetical protein
MREIAASGLLALIRPKLNCRVMGMMRRFERCADSRSRAWRSGSTLQQRTLQYFAVALLTGTAHPRRAQIRRGAGRDSVGFDAPAATAGSV